MSPAKLAVTSAIFALCGSALFAQKADTADYANLVSVLKQTCLATFPNYNGMETKAVAAGFKSTKDGGWISDDVFLRAAGTKTPVEKRTCAVNLRKKSDAKSVSTYLQTEIQNLGVREISAKRKGVRLSVGFSLRGRNGVMRVEPLGGRTASIIVLVQSD